MSIIVIYSASRGHVQEYVNRTSITIITTGIILTYHHHHHYHNHQNITKP